LQPTPQAEAQNVEAQVEPLERLSWISDDYAHALAQARAQHVPLFIDLWATWCHTCLSMRSYVFNQPEAEHLRSRVIWLALDVDLAKNAEIVEKFPFDALPTFYLLDPANERALVRWSGAMSFEQLRGMIEEGEAGISLPNAAQQRSPWLLDVARAEEALSANNPQLAAIHFKRAYLQAPSTWRRRPAIATATVAALARSQQKSACIAFVEELLPSAPAVAATSDAIGYALDCIGEDKEADARLLQVATQTLSRIVNDSTAALSADDRSDAYGMLVSIHKQNGDLQAAQQASLARLAMLETAVAAASTPAMASTYDGARLDTLLELGRPADAVRFLEKSAALLPDDYNPRARLARAHLANGNLQAARTANEEALKMAYGARRVVIWSTQAEIDEASGMWSAAEQDLRRALQDIDALPPSPKYSRLRDMVNKKLSALRERYNMSSDDKKH
jgi:thioredoxin-like negative regulator of GroEL